MSVLSISLNTETLVQILTLGFAAFIAAMAVTPIYTTLAYKYEWWKRPRTTTLTGEVAKVFSKLHAAKHKRLIPTMAGAILVVAVAFVTIIGNLTRQQTWLPLAALIGGGMVGLIDDIINIRSDGTGIAGLRSKIKLLLMVIVASIGGWWFWAKLDVTSIHVPVIGTWELGWLIVPLFAFVVVATANAVNMTDGLDGLAGGLTTTAFGVYAIIAFLEKQYFLSGFCMSMVGALLSYTWFNIYPARFFMGDVGSFAIGTALGVVAMMTDTVALLPIIGLVFVCEAGSVILQITSKKLRNGKKIFRVSPVHHHFEAIGWPETKVTMRFWIIGQVAGVIGLIVFLMGGYL